MITILFYSNQEEAKLFLLNGDYSHLNNVYINNVPDEDNTQEKQDELNDLLFNSEGTFKTQELSVKEAEKIMVESKCRIIMGGFIL
jgi:hypothetical protein